MLEMLEIEPRRAVTCAVIWLHGLGADGNDFEPLIRQWDLADELGARFVLPHAPTRPVTLNNGMVMRAWYDIYDLGFSQCEDRQGVEQAQQHLLSLILRERERGLPSDRILLAGFSQGGAVALYTALRFTEPLAGVLALSAYLPLADRLAGEKRADPLLTIRMDHGEQDQVVPFALAERSRERIEEQGYHVDFHAYVMGHSLCIPQMESLRHWIAMNLQSPPGDT
ncbi:MAG: phospholipase/carboxylesterase [Gammaproteobacteria bacterium]|nr:MAG: phospholipase/carboxylesterase [Gammaproteobacteria bacterium]